MTMEALVPNRFLFDFEFPLAYRAKPPRIDGDLSDWSDAERLPRLGELDGREEFGSVWVCWNERGLYAACRVENKRRALSCSAKSFWTGDNFRLCTDMRDARSARRASRFCQMFYFLPTGGGSKKSDPVAGSSPIQRARENAAVVEPGRIAVAAEVRADGYCLEAHIPADCLSGFDPVEHPRIGFYYILEDADFGQQYLTVGDDLYWYVDPSTWATAVLERSEKKG